MNLHILQQIKDQLINDPKFNFYMKNYMYGHNDVTFKLDNAMTLVELKEILDVHDFENKYHIDSFVESNGIDDLRLTFFYLRKL
jgi:hypothetical protein